MVVMARITPICRILELMMRKHFLLTVLCASIFGAGTQSALAEELNAGSYLSSRFAQSHHDWVNASDFLENVVHLNVSEEEMLTRSMILAMGSGDVARAFEIAQTLHDAGKINSVANIFLTMDAFKNKDYDDANRILKSTPIDPTIQFVGPFVNAWLKAAQGEVDLTALQGNTIQLYHGILISDFLDNHTAVEKMIQKALSVEDINTAEIERIADLYGHVGLTEKAIDLYNKVLETESNNDALVDKIERMKSGTFEPLFKEIKTVDEGMAQAFHDIANILSNEENDESARVFAHIALYLDPAKSETKFLLGDINARHKQYDEAISYYGDVPKSSDDYIKAQHKIADIYEDSDRVDDALALLEQLTKDVADVDSIIKKGDLYRRQEKFKKAISVYDTAEKKLGDSIPENYWHLLYVRGISYEQSDDWEKAEKDLKAALKFQPDHPYVLNYLGYAWADQGENLDEARDMIQRAVDLRPSDGYITDSLGWVLYRMKDYNGAARWLEKAVELLPYDPTVNDHLGDAYWKVGRRLEARFQWERAKNYSDEEEQIESINKKLLSGIASDDVTAH